MSKHAAKSCSTLNFNELEQIHRKCLHNILSTSPNHSQFPSHLQHPSLQKHPNLLNFPNPPQNSVPKQIFMNFYAFTFPGWICIAPGKVQACPWWWGQLGLKLCQWSLCGEIFSAPNVRHWDPPHAVKTALKVQFAALDYFNPSTRTD